MDYDKDWMIIVGLDYFSRFMFASAVKTKKTAGIIKFLDKVKDKLQIKQLKSYSGREFVNKSVEKWCEIIQ